MKSISCLFLLLTFLFVNGQSKIPTGSTRKITAQHPKKTSGSSLPPNTEIWAVDAQQLPCEDASGKLCLLVKQAGKNEFEIFHDSIRGFDYQPGFVYVIRVKKVLKPAPLAADASIYAYYLDKVESRKAVQTEDPESNSGHPAWLQGKTALDKRWFLRKMKDSDTTSFEVEDNAVWIEFYSIDSRFKGQAPCNSYFGGFRSDLISTFQASAVAGTKMYCGNMKLEDLYFTLLQNADHFEVKDGKLSLFKGKRLLLVFE